MTPRIASTGTATSRPIRNALDGRSTLSRPAEMPSRARPTQTAAIASHSLRPRRSFSIGMARMAVTARLAARHACTTKMGSVRRARNWTTNPAPSSARPTRNVGCMNALMAEVGARFAAMAWNTDAAP